MASVFIITLILCTTAFVSAIPSDVQYQYPIENRRITELTPMQDLSNYYKFEIIPNDQYALKEYDDSLELSLWDLIPTPHTYVITTIGKVVSTAVSALKWIVLNSFLTILGMAIVIGFCAFTPYCTLTIEKPLPFDLFSINRHLLDNLEHYVTDAYRIYQDMQS